MQNLKLKTDEIYRSYMRAEQQQAEAQHRQYMQRQSQLRNNIGKTFSIENSTGSIMSSSPSPSIPCCSSLTSGRCCPSCRGCARQSWQCHDEGQGTHASHRTLAPLCQC